ncbi:MAG TPA: hypothetical protein VH518_01595 [Tepidisphaeraceae bacterium]|jgi:DNA ligase D-like protein (predicted ligase)
MQPKVLPAFIEPMLAKAAEPFDSDDFLYEIKWDGFRAVCYVENGQYRLVGRKKTDYTFRFPELSELAHLPDGCAIDGEIVAMVDGKPNFIALAQRPQLPQRARVRYPVTFVAFDLLYQGFERILQTPCEDRRARLASVLERAVDPCIAISRSVNGDGIGYFQQVQAMGLEGVVAKRRTGRYEPGKRSGSWLKFKQQNELLCAIIGYEVGEARPIRSLIVAAPVESDLKWVGQVGSGITSEMHDKLLALLSARLCKHPLVTCTIKGKWVVPDLFCRVSYLEWTEAGKLRGPVFLSLHEH